MEAIEPIRKELDLESAQWELNTLYHLLDMEEAEPGEHQRFKRRLMVLKDFIDSTRGE